MAPPPPPPPSAKPAAQTVDAPEPPEPSPWVEPAARSADAHEPPLDPPPATSDSEPPSVAADDDDPARVWLPQLVERFAAFLPPNEVACGLRLVNKATAALLTSREHTTILISQPVPHRDFARRWGNPPALRPLTWSQRRQLLRLTARSGSLANLDTLLGLADYCPLRPDVLEAAAGAGQLAMCQVLRQRGCPWSHSVLDAAAYGGDWETCCWLLANGCPWNRDAPGSAARGGHVGLMDWLLAVTSTRGAAVGGDVNEVFARGVAARGDAAVYRWNELVDTAGSPTPDWRAKVDWLLQHGGAWPAQAPGWFWLMRFANAKQDWQARLGLLRQQWGAGAEEAFVLAAIKAGNLDAAHGLLPAALPPGHPEADSLVQPAAEGGHLSVLQLLESLGYPLGRKALEEALVVAARGGHLQTVIWLGERLGGLLGGARRPAPQRQPLTAGLFREGAKSGSLEMLEWLRERGCPWDARVFVEVASEGSEEQLEWLAARGCPMGDDGAPYVMPAARGDLSTLRCLRRLGCSLAYGGTTFERAVKEGLCLSEPQPAGLAWLLEQGWRVKYWAQFKHHLRPEALEWLQEVQRRSLGQHNVD
ncbi:hypothetical protein PLESTF_001766200 [Pleodorina starrii]|nr:hypothetical protein PLESTF_001766200 [Pleodorina starrii]